MRPAGAAEALEPGQLDVGCADARLAGAGLMELVTVGSVGALNAAIAIGAFGRQHDRPDVERRLADRVVERLRGQQTASDSLTAKPASIVTLMRSSWISRPGSRLRVPQLPALGGAGKLAQALFQRQDVARDQPTAFRAVACEAPSRRSRSNSASLSKRSATCGESSSRTTSRR